MQRTSDFLNLAGAPLAAEDFKDFLGALRSATLEMHELLTSETRGEAEDVLASLTEALSTSRSCPRQRRVLELCAWPLFDKPMVEPQLGSDAEFLWLFALPLLVRLPEDCGPVVSLPEDFVRTDLLIEALEQAGCLAPGVVVSGFSTLFSREDLHAQGPLELATTVVNLEEGMAETLPVPLPLVVDPEIESSRTVLLFAQMVARLPVHAREIFAKNANWPVHRLQQLLQEDLSAAQVPWEAVSVLPACRMSELLLRSTGPGLQELESHIELAALHYPLRSVHVVFPTSGVAELVGCTTEGEELLLAPSFYFSEPAQVLAGVLRNVCNDKGINFTGAVASVIPTSSMLQ